MDNGNGSVSLRRFYITKRPDLDTCEQSLKNDLTDFVNIKGLQNIVALLRADFDQLTDYEAERILSLLVDPAQDLHIRTLASGGPDLVAAKLDFPSYELVVEPVAGQYDQRADMATQMAQIVLEKDIVPVRTAVHYLFYGDLTDIDRERIKRWLINPVESEEGVVDLPETTQRVFDKVSDITVYNGFIELSPQELMSFLSKQQLAMTIDDLSHIQEYFRSLRRDPTETEIKVLDTYWSDHCRHTTFNTELNTVSFPPDIDNEFKSHLANSWQRYLDWHRHFDQLKQQESAPTLMDIATIATKILQEKIGLSDLDQSEEINACSIKVPVELQGNESEVLLMFKNETHNHPTEIEPFGGAGTCLGGAIRDPLSGRAYAYQAMRVSGGADPRQDYDRTLPGKLPQRQIARLASLGYSSYGNEIGIAAGHVAEFYHPGFAAKRLEAGAILAAVPSEQVRRYRPRPNDVVILVGGKTGRDGIGGATGSSQSHHQTSHKQSAAEVQKGNPALERNLQRLFRNPELSRLIRRCNDFGAGGVAVAIGELSEGLLINLDLVPLKYEGLNGTEIALSESQERMAVVVSKQDADSFLAHAAEENLEATIVATVTEEPVLKMIWRGQTIVELERSFLDTNGATQRADAFFSPSRAADWFVSPASHGSFTEQLLAVLSDLNNCSRKGLIERFDSTIGSGTVLLPLGGKTQLTPEMGMASLIPVAAGESSETASLMTCGYDPYLAEASPYHGGYFAVLTALSKILSMGGDPFSARLSLQEYFGKVTNRETWGKPLTALLGAFDAILDFGTPAIGGKDSMSGTYEDLHVPPSLIAFAVATTSARKVVSATFRHANMKVYSFSVPLNSSYLVNIEAWRQRLVFIRDLMRENKVINAATVDGGGLAVAILKSLWGEALGFKFASEPMPDLFAPAPGSLLVSFTEDVLEKDIVEAGGVLLGLTTNDKMVVKDDEGISLGELLEAWIMPLDEIYPLSTYKTKAFALLADSDLEPKSCTTGPAIVLGDKKPQVLIPVLPGTNSEDDLAQAFRQAGAETELLIFKNRNSDDIKHSLQQLAKRIVDSQILVFAGASPGIAHSVFSTEQVAEAVMNMLNDSQKLILGTGRGFAELLQLGLLPHGEIRARKISDPTLALNARGDFISRTVTTKYMNAKSPWLQLFMPDQLDRVPIAGNKGRLVIPLDTLDHLMSQEQIAFCYADNQGQPTGFEPWNPTGSVLGIEGLISPDGRILGKFGLSERYRHMISQNDATIHGQPLFLSAVKWLVD
ncbi:MAG TPA: phosphoribosylformylglycinamidine synthase [Clostridiaceae bacterium]|nr:phosphoribosylformylglycinamidine synthase [Clostridiaceae bacterium]